MCIALNNGKQKAAFPHGSQIPGCLAGSPEPAVWQEEAGEAWQWQVRKISCHYTFQKETLQLSHTRPPSPGLKTANCSRPSCVPHPWPLQTWPRRRGWSTGPESEPWSPPCLFGCRPLSHFPHLCRHSRIRWEDSPDHRSLPFYGSLAVCGPYTFPSTPTLSRGPHPTAEAGIDNSTSTWRSCEAPVRAPPSRLDLFSLILYFCLSFKFILTFLNF